MLVPEKFLRGQRLKQPVFVDAFLRFRIQTAAGRQQPHRFQPGGQIHKLPAAFFPGLQLHLQKQPALGLQGRIACFVHGKLLVQRVVQGDGSRADHGLIDGGEHPHAETSQREAPADGKPVMFRKMQ
ncbi:hypothetical protein D3C75_933520 [compost metagenome]